jgi:hypothetical protein
MIRTLNLNGEARTVLFGNLAFKMLFDETETTLAGVGERLQGQDITVVSTVLYYGLRAGERYDRKAATEYDANDVALWMDLEGGAVATKVLPWILEAISDITGEAAADEEATKKKTPKAPRSAGRK